MGCSASRSTAVAVNEQQRPKQQPPATEKTPALEINAPEQDTRPASEKASPTPMARLQPAEGKEMGVLARQQHDAGIRNGSLRTPSPRRLPPLNDSKTATIRSNTSSTLSSSLQRSPASPGIFSKPLTDHPTSLRPCQKTPQCSSQGETIPHICAQTYTHTHILTHSHTHTLTHALTHSLSLSLSLSFPLSFLSLSLSLSLSFLSSLFPLSFL